MGDLLNKLGPYAPWYLAGIILLLAVGFGWRDLMRLSWGRIWAISSVSFSESIRRRVLWITPIAILGVMIVSQLQRPFDEQDAIRQTTKFALFTTGLVVVIIGILLASTSLPKEIENRVIFTVVTKPTTRLEIVLGKTLGFARVSATILLIMGVFTAVYLQVRAWNLRRDIAARLDAGFVEPLSRPTLEHYRAFGLLNAKSYTPRADLQFYAKLPPPNAIRRYAVPGGENQVVIPFDLTPEMFGDGSTPRGMAVKFTVGYERNASYQPDADPSAPPSTQPSTQPDTDTAAFGPTPLLPVGPMVAIGFLDVDETALVNTSEMNKGGTVRLPPPGAPGSVVVDLTPENITKLANAARHPATRRVYFVVTGTNAEYLYYFEDQPASLLIGEMTPQGPKVVQEVLPAPDPYRDGKPSMGIFRGGYSRYGQQLRGGDPNGVVAVYHFHKAGDIATDTANFEMKLGIDRGGTESGDEEDTITEVSIQIRNTGTGQTTPAQVIKPETNRMAYFSFPKDAVAGGDFDLIVRCITPQHMIGLQPGGLAMVADTGSFYANLVKSLLIFWLLSVLVVSVAICCSTFLSWPIAVVLCVVVLLGKWGVEQLGDATKPGIGAQVATDFGFRDPRQAKVVSESVETLTKALNILARVLPDISQFPATEDIERGISIPGEKLMESLKESLAFGIPLLLLGYVVLKNKEVAP